MAKHLSRGVSSMKWPRSTIMYIWQVNANNCDVWFFYTWRRHDELCCSKWHFRRKYCFFFRRKNILNIVFACQHFPLLFTGLHNHICKLYNRNYNHRKISSHTYYVVITCREILDFYHRKFMSSKMLLNKMFQWIL